MNQALKISLFLSDHQNWFGTDENLGPLAISIRREKVPVHPNAAELFLTPRNLDPDKDFREQVKQDLFTTGFVTMEY